MTSILQTCPWTNAATAAPATSLRDIMAQEVAQAPFSHKDDAPYWGSISVESANVPDTSSDFAMALALQLEEQMSAHTVDYARLVSVLDDSVVTLQRSARRSPLVRRRPPSTVVDAVDDLTPSLRATLHHHQRRKTHRKPVVKPLRPAHVVVVEDDATESDSPLDGLCLYELFFNAEVSFHDVAHELAFCVDDSV